MALIDNKFFGTVKYYANEPTFDSHLRLHEASGENKVWLERLSKSVREAPKGQKVAAVKAWIQEWKAHNAAPAPREPSPQRVASPAREPSVHASSHSSSTASEHVSRTSSHASSSHASPQGSDHSSPASSHQSASFFQFPQRPRSPQRGRGSGGMGL